MRFDILTLFPALFDSVFSDSIVKRAIDAGRVEIHIHNIRDYAPGKHRVTDDTPYGGGGGMVMKVEPIVLALEAILGAERVARQKESGIVEVPIVLLTPAGRLFNQSIAHEYEAKGRLVLICGRYEGVDERVAELAATDELSIGDYVLSGGEIPAMVVVEAVTRLVPGVLGDMRALVEDSHARGLLEYPHYTRPFIFRGRQVPEVLVSGDHARVERWRREQALRRTLERRPELLAKAPLSAADLRFLAELLREKGNAAKLEALGIDAIRRFAQALADANLGPNAEDEVLGQVLDLFPTEDDKTQGADVGEANAGPDNEPI
ncbi:MAG: tRNA (guanosine(37)-N1)-methyltransferase TrmD [Chloroflexi bacterium]|nr:tRNA (guanosine(37)-N1)-methyltransferase TrmD [Chloroflexota bacterium]